jgi:hypothetical protein
MKIPRGRFYGFGDFLEFTEEYYEKNIVEKICEGYRCGRRKRAERSVGGY